MTLLLRLIALYRPHAGWVGLAILVSLAATLANIGLMATSGWFITAMAAAGLAHVAMDYFTPAALIRFFAIVRTGGRYFDRVISHETTFRLLAQLRTTVFAGLVPLAPGALTDLRSGDVLARLGADIDRLELVFLRLVSPLIVAVLACVAVVVALGLLRGSLALAVGSALAIAGIGFPLLAAHIGRKPSRAIAETSAAMRSQLVDDLQGLAALQLTGADVAHGEMIRARMDALIAGETRLARAEGLGQAGVGLAGDLAAVMVLIVGIPLVRDGALGGPDLAMAALLALSSFEALSAVPLAFAGLAGAVASARRLFALLDRAPMVREAMAPHPASGGFAIVYAGVGLRYPGARHAALSGIDLAIGEGMRLGVVGMSGAGKSSLAALLLRFRDPDQGEIRLGGVAIRDLALADVRKTVVAATQSPHLFTASIAENLRLADPKASDGALMAALRIVGLDRMVAALPDGLATQVGISGTRLSGGEARRLAVARALIAKSPVLVLDEPSEGLDPDSERRFFDALLADAVGRTLILLTHRPQALARMDEIVVLEAGRIVERGAPFALRTRGGAFARLFERID